MLAFLIVCDHSSSAQGKKRKVTVTLDDLPIVSLLNSHEQKQLITRRLLHTLTSFEVPAIGFVNESKLYNNGELDSTQVELLEQWVTAGLELGNHTFSHPSLHNLDTKAYYQEIIKGQIITDTLLSEFNGRVSFFRHPYLHTGNSLEKKRAIEAFLDKNGLVVAPVTVDNSDWIFARAYDNAIIEKDSSLMEQLGEAYINYMEDCFAYYEDQSVRLVGYEVNQFLLLHANTINADYLDEILAMLVTRGYSFVSTGEGLKDPAYQLKDEFVGEKGISWIHRWALTQGKEASFFEGEPETPDFVVETANLQ